jgi:hypothetical protein
MVKSVSLAKEIIVTVQNKIGILADISRMLADHGINIEGVAGYAQDKEAKIMIVTDDNLRTVEALQKGGYKSVKENEVVIVELVNKPGALKDLAGRLAEAKIDIRYCYGTTCAEGCPAKIVLSTVNNEKTAVLFTKK